MSAQPGRPRAGRRAPGEGSIIHNEKRNRYEGWYSQGSGANRVRAYVTGKTRKEAAEKLRKLAERARTNDLRNTPSTVAELAERWWVAQGKKVEQSTQVSRWDRIVLHIVNDPLISSTKIQKLRTEHIERWLTEKALTGYSRNGAGRTYSHRYLELIRGDLNMMVRWAIRRHWLTFNPVTEASIPATPTTDPKRTLSREQALALRATCERSVRPFATYMLVLMLTGARPGEIAALRFDDIDVEAGVIHIRQAMKRGKGGRPTGLGETKTHHTRSIEVGRIVLDAIERERQNQAMLREAAGSYWSTDWDGLIFLTLRGTPPWPSNLRRTLRKLTEDADAGIPTDLDPYELRHSCASLLADAGVPVQSIVDQLGHKDDRVFWNHYRIRVDPVVRNADAIGRIFEQR